MIIDNLKNFSLYEKMDPLFKAAFDFLRSLEGLCLNGWPTGSGTVRRCGLGGSTSL